jgi:hypothetical protein
VRADILCGKCVIFAGCNTLVAADAFFFKIPEADFIFNSLGILAPHTSQRAAFKKNRASNAWPVVNCKPFDIYNIPIHQLFP